MEQYRICPEVTITTISVRSSEWEFSEIAAKSIELLPRDEIPIILMVGRRIADTVLEKFVEALRKADLPAHILKPIGIPAKTTDYEYYGPRIMATQDRSISSD